ncbi:MAG: hypothetical protein JRF50_17665 [Deltaproteobacteria bacterium]|nr:hypothetical protein [Deltaproteobacteria bacterium]
MKKIIDIYIFKEMIPNLVTSLVETGTINPAVAMWIPDMVLGIAAVTLIWRAARNS